MRIIDKNHDFYDYLQDPTDKTIVFDRRGSFLLDKKQICDAMRRCDGRNEDHEHKLILLQCGAMFWVFLATVTKFDNTYTAFQNEIPEAFDLELIKSWKDYNAKSVIIRVEVCPCYWHRWDYKAKKYIFERPKNDAITSIPEGIDITCYKTSVQTKNGFETKTYEFPILYGTEIPNLINPLDVFCAIEEHFSREKTASERTEPLGITNDDKITMHGFDTKTSFRGKN